MEEVPFLLVYPLWIVLMGSSSLRGLLLRFFGNSTSNISKYIIIIVLRFTILLECASPGSSWVGVVIRV